MKKKLNLFIRNRQLSNQLDPVIGVSTIFELTGVDEESTSGYQDVYVSLLIQKRDSKALYFFNPHEPNMFVDSGEHDNVYCIIVTYLVINNLLIASYPRTETHVFFLSTGRTR